MSSVPTQIELTSEQRTTLTQLSEACGKPWAEVLNEALRRFRVADRFAADDVGRSFFDVLTCDGAIAIAKDLPSDLSTNTAHLEGFGRGRANSD